MTRSVPLLVLPLLLAAACGEGAEERAEREAAETREIMGRIYEGIRVALPASVENSFDDPARSAELAAALDLLAENASLLERHALHGDAQLRFLARSAARDARDVRAAFRAGRHDRAAFLVRQMTENCVVCHTRLPDAEDAPTAQGFVDDGGLQDLALESRATLQIATRRFDDALASLEALLASPEHPALLLGPITDYLVVSIRVKGDYDRPVATLRKLAARPDLWTKLRRDVERWIAALPELRERTRGEPSLAVARSILDEARSLTVLPEDHTGLVHDVAASAVLQRLLDARTAGRRDLAEALYLLGIIEARIGRNYWVTPAPFLLEKAIRLAPGEPFAEEAYAVLERELLQVYEGADEDALPEDDAERLRELRALLDAR